MTRAPSPIWTPLSRTELEALLEQHDYTTLHLSLLSWLIWLSLLSGEELLRVQARKGAYQMDADDLAEQLRRMAKLGLIDAIRLREPFLNRHKRYYATDLGLHLYHATVRSSPPLSLARLARSYPIERDDLLARLARPHLHLACMSLVTRIIAEGEQHGDYLVSYQQPWHHSYTFAHKKHLLASDAALLVEQKASGISYGFLVHIDVEPHQPAEREVEKWLLSLLDVRQRMRVSRQHWPDLLIISTSNRLPLWTRLLLQTSSKRTTKPLAGGLTTLDALHDGVYTPIWWDLVLLAVAAHRERVPFSHLLRVPASMEMVEHFSKHHHFYELLLQDEAAPPPRTRKQLTRYVGNALHEEATQVTKEHLEALFANKRKNRQSLEGSGLLTLRLTAAEKELLTWAAHHPLLDLPTFQALLRPQADPLALKPLQQHITRLFTLGLLESRRWAKGKTPREQQRYLLTSVGLKFLATRHGEPYSYYVIPPKQQKGDDEQLDRQWGTRGLNAQMWHTHALYSFMGRLYRGAQTRGEVIYHWKSAHEAALWYRDSISQEDEHARPDAELVFALSPTDQRITTISLEYDRGTTGTFQYSRKFTAYLDYQQATGRIIPLLVVSVSRKATERMQQVLDTLEGTLRLLMLLEDELLSQGLALVLHHFPP